MNKKTGPARDLRNGAPVNPVLFAVLSLLSLLLGALRIAGVKSLAFQGIAHVFVGGLFGAYAGGRVRRALWLAIALTVLETICFLASVARPL